MTQQQFNLECFNRTIEPSIALENEELIEALQSRDDELVIEILNNQF
jgi:hypothetical protein